MRASRHHLALWGLHHAARFYGPKFAQYLLGPVGAVAGSVWTARELSHLYRKYKTQEMRLPWTSRPAKRRKTSRSEIMPASAVQLSNGMFAGQKISYYKKKGGKRFSKNQKALAHIRQHVEPLVERWQKSANVVVADAPTRRVGAEFLTAGPSTSSTVIQWPVFLYDLTGVKNAVSVNSTLVNNFYPTVCYGLQSDTATPGENNFSYFPITGRTAQDNNDVFSWTAEQIARLAALVSDVPNAGGNGFIDSFKLKMTVYGATDLPSEVNVNLIRFSDEKLVPRMLASDSNTNTPGTLYDTIDQSRLNQFWTYHLSKLIGPQNADQVKKEHGDGIVMEKLWHFKFGPQDADNPDPGGTQRNLTLDYQFNRSLRLDWFNNENAHIRSGADAPNTIGNPDYFIQYNLANSANPHPNQKSRVFLMVTGDIQQYHGTARSVYIATENASKCCPSFDIQIRRFRTIVQDG